MNKGIQAMLRENREDIIELYHGGESAIEIAKAFGTDKANIYDFLKKEGVFKSTFSKKDFEEIKKLHDQGLSSRAIDIELGMPLGSARRELVKNGIQSNGDFVKRDDPLGDHYAEIEKLYKEGKSCNQIAEIFKANQSSVYALLKKRGATMRPKKERTIKTPRKKYTSEILRDNGEEIVSLYLNGTGATEIAKKFNCGAASVRNFLREQQVIKKPLTVIHEEEILEMHEQGISAYQINQKLNLPQGTSHNVLTKFGLAANGQLKHREDPLYLYEEEIIDMYNQGIGVCSIAKYYNAAEISITRILKKNGVETAQWAGPIYKVNHNFFDVIDTEQKAYILGLFIGDGSQNKYMMRFQMKDYDILQKIGQALDSDHKIYDVPRDDKHIYSLCIYSQKLCEKLTEYGYPENKTFCVKFPSETIVPKHLQRHCIRGILDSDGSIVCGHEGESLRDYSLSFVGTTFLMNNLADIIFDELGIQASVFPAKNASHGISNLKFGGSHQVKAFLDWLYNDSNIHMDRKFERYQNFLKIYNDKYNTTLAT